MTPSELRLKINFLFKTAEEIFEDPDEQEAIGDVLVEMAKENKRKAAVCHGMLNGFKSSVDFAENEEMKRFIETEVKKRFGKKIQFNLVTL